MDAANNSGRKYPSYTTKELKQFVAEGRGNPVIEKEIADRESGLSRLYVVPQVERLHA